MLGPFFRLAMLSVSRQATFRRAVVVHLLVVGSMGLALYASGPRVLPVVGQFLLIAGIVEGGALIGWRLTQLPKSQALEFLLVSPLRPRVVFVAEALVGLSRLGLVTLAGLPILVLLVFLGRLELVDLGPLLLMPYTWGAITGLGLTMWAYESVRVRRWGERMALLLIIVYLVVGVLAGEHLLSWLQLLPDYPGWLLWQLFLGFHHYNPFGVMKYWLETPAWIAIDRMWGVELYALLLVGILMARGASRMKGHFHERHYSPILDPTGQNRGTIGERPLSWWAVKRVTEYSGRVNLWLAGGFGVLYALFTVAGDQWPMWLGRRVFEIVDGVGGVPVLATGLVVLAAVPAAFQYGLWDSNAQDRCRRLELLLLTELDASDYWDAAAAAAWRRGRGYFYVALLLWGAGAAAGQMDGLQLTAGLTAGVVLWALYFAIGFRAFSSGMQANGLGSLLTLGLPLVAYALVQVKLPILAMLVPPGSVFFATTEPPTLLWAIGPLLGGLTALWVARHALAHCDRELRLWYEQHHGSKLLD